MGSSAWLRRTRNCSALGPQKTVPRSDGFSRSNRAACGESVHDTKASRLFDAKNCSARTRQPNEAASHASVLATDNNRLELSYTEQ